MDAAVAIANLATFDVIPGKLNQKEFRAFLVEVQDCILRMQRENLDLRRENQALRRRAEFALADSVRQKQASMACISAVSPPTTPRLQSEYSKTNAPIPVPLASAV